MFDRLPWLSNKERFHYPIDRKKKLDLEKLIKENLKIFLNLLLKYLSHPIQ